MVIVLHMMTYMLCLRAVLLMRSSATQAGRAVDSDIARRRAEEAALPPAVHARGAVPLFLILWNALREQQEQDAGICG